MELSDNELAVLAGKGDPEAYRWLFDRYRKPVYNFVYRLVDNAEDASDIVQDAFIRIYSVLGATEIQNFSAYLYRTAKNLAYDEMRRRARFADFDEEMLLPEDPNIYADPQRALLLGEQIETVRRAARGLNENQRAALILRELQELDYDQMSDVLESNRNAVGALLSRARLKFREELRMAQVSTDQCPSGCEEVIAMLSPYIDGELTAAANEKVEAHLEDCTFCLAALEEMKEASRSFRMFLPVVPPPGVAQAFTGWLAELTGSVAGDPSQLQAQGSGSGSDPQSQGIDPGESPQLQAQGIGSSAQTQEYVQDRSAQGRSGGSGPSDPSRLFRSKTFWIATGVVVVLLAMASVLAWGFRGSPEPAPPAFQDTGADVPTTTGMRSATDSGREEPAIIEDTEPAANKTEPPTPTTPTTTPTTATTPTTESSTTPIVTPVMPTQESGDYPGSGGQASH
ncbi:MAG: sigma-70 family RNA polymerase sigma factor [Thermoleophilia bacterium]